MREDQADQIIHLLQNINGVIYNMTQRNYQPQILMGTAANDEDRLAECRERISDVNDTVDTLARSFEVLNKIGKLEDRHVAELLDATNELMALREREKALQALIVINHPQVEVGIPPTMTGTTLFSPPPPYTWLDTNTGGPGK